MTELEEADVAVATTATTIPAEFASFLAQNDIDPAIYAHSPPRYFFSLHLAEDDAVVKAGAQPQGMVPGFYRASRSVPFSASRLYREGRLLPMDLSSGLAVHLLALQSGDHVLDLCCAPGGKLVLAGLLLRDGGSVTGVDLAPHRLATCRALVKKYRLPRVRLFCADGASFDERVVLVEGDGHAPLEHASLEHPPALRPFHETTAYRKRRVTRTARCYDKVLVDAQCTHDGSVKHVRKQMDAAWRGFDLTQFEPARLAELHALQLALLQNGFRLLRPGGILVYSTCSLSRGQNEEVVREFLRSEADVRPLPFVAGADASCAGGQLRLAPPAVDSGFFIFRCMRVN